MLQSKGRLVLVGNANQTEVIFLSQALFPIMWILWISFIFQAWIWVLNENYILENDRNFQNKWKFIIIKIWVIMH